MSYPSMMSGIAPPPLPGPTSQAPAARPLLFQVFSCSWPHLSPVFLPALSSHLLNIGLLRGWRRQWRWWHNLWRWCRSSMLACCSCSPSPPSCSSPAPPSPGYTELSAPLGSPKTGQVTHRVDWEWETVLSPHLKLSVPCGELNVPADKLPRLLLQRAHCLFCLGQPTYLQTN